MYSCLKKEGLCCQDASKQVLYKVLTLSRKLQDQYFKAISIINCSVVENGTISRINNIEHKIMMGGVFFLHFPFQLFHKWLSLLRDTDTISSRRQRAFQ
jgi:hypothetical protein